jgi:methylmalonyl-CoA mutase N-terminal domain/subunit
MRERVGAADEASWRMRFHTQTAGSALTAQQPENNIVRVALQALAAVLGGTQSLHTNAFDEALGLPTARSARIALRTQQIIAHETGVADTVDPLAGSYYVEWLTDRVEQETERLIGEIDAAGGSVAAIEAGVMQRMIEDAAYRDARRQEDGEAVVVGVNRFVDPDESEVPLAALDPQGEADQRARLERWRADRSDEAVRESLAEVRRVASGDGNLLYPMKRALEARATLGEISAVLIGVFGKYRPGS